MATVINKVICGANKNHKREDDVDAGGDIGFWRKRFATAKEMFAEMTKHNYDGYKVASLRNYNPEGEIKSY